MLTLPQPRSPRPVSAEQQPLTELAHAPNENASPTKLFSASPVGLPHRLRAGSFVPLSGPRSLPRVVRKPSFRLEDLSAMEGVLPGRADTETLLDCKEYGDGQEDLSSSGPDFSSRMGSKVTLRRPTPLLVTRRVIDIREKEARLHKRLPRAASVASGLLLSPRSLLSVTPSP
eukprot:EG_transcript_22705